MPRRGRRPAGCATFGHARRVPLSKLTRLTVPLALLLAAPASAATAVDAPTRTVEAGGITIGYRVVGTGRPVVLVQGLGGTMDGWDPAFVDGLARQGRRVVLLDNRGAGRTDLRSGTLSVRRMSGDVAALIAKLRLGRPDVVGWSMGGMIVQSLAVRYPQRVRRVALLASAPGDGEATPPSADATAALAADDPAGLLSRLFPPAADAARDGYIRRVARRRGFAPIVPAATRTQQLLASAEWLLGRDPAGRRIAKLRMPVLVGSGVQDELLPARNQRHLAKVIPNARLVSYADASHGFFVQHRVPFLRRLDAFLGG